MTGPVTLNSLEIRNFRVFRHLRIERLGRVNLITGKNNVGKTCLLEALRLYADWLSIRHLLESRDEAGPLPVNQTEDAAELIAALKYLFHGRADIARNANPIQIGSIDAGNKMLSIALDWELGESLGPELVITVGAQPPFRYPSHKPIHYRRLGTLEVAPNIRHVFVPPDGLRKQQLNLLWDSTTLTDLEADVLAAIHIIAPQVERVNLVGAYGRDQGRTLMVRVAGHREPIPLRSLGEGVNRLFGIALALVNAKDGLLLVDEIDSGLHYSVQPALWRLVFQVAQRLNVQVFATTHSWDCIEGFQRAASKDEEAEGVLISLREREGEITAVLFDEQELEIATREQIEVR